MRTVHKVTNIKISPVNILKNNPDDDFFIAMPKNALPKGIRTAIGTKSKDTFSPEEIEVSQSSKRNLPKLIEYSCCT
jgi:hypothetical protein